MPQVAWVTGTAGLIGSNIAAAAPDYASPWRVRSLTRAQLDLCDFSAVKRAFSADRPDLVIHCAALSRSPDCQANPKLAWRSNVEATEHLAHLARDARFIFFSTDLVFDGHAGNYTESAPVNPLSVYAETKVAAERIVLTHPKHIVIRTSLNGGTSPTRDRGFNEQLRLAWENGQAPRLFTDEFRSPIAASVTARAVWEIVSLDLAGLVHLAGAERLSRWQIGQLVAARWPQLNPRIESGSLKDYAGAPRAPDTSLNCERLKEVLSFRLPGLTEWLQASPDEIF
jgi:dTDP-4-dehydrorhamnose reductase